MWSSHGPDRSATDLSPLGRVIDAEALDRLVDSRFVENSRPAIDVTFHYEGYRIEIEADGTVNILLEQE